MSFLSKVNEIPGVSIGLYLVFQIEKYMSTSKLKYYFAVDTSYVGKKLGLLVFPFAHTVSSHNNMQNVYKILSLL